MVAMDSTPQSKNEEDKENQDFFLTQKEEQEKSDSDHTPTAEGPIFTGASYEKYILDLFQEIEEKTCFLINNVQDEDQTLEYIRFNKHMAIEK